MSKRKPTDAADAKSGGERPTATTAQDDEEFRGWRETIESIVVAIILALLFRTFEAEAFVIPTGSMATTLMGRHKDVACEECGQRYQMGATDRMEQGGTLDETICPSCGFRQRLDPAADLNQSSFTGDRILVNKFAYALGEPQRWDVFVFRYPGNAKQNFIKRLVGLPNETLRVRHGDIYTQPLDQPAAPFVLQRKPPHKVLAMLQLVHDTRHRAKSLVAAGEPSRWQQFVAPDDPPSNVWQVLDEGQRFQAAAQAGGTAWLRYRHLMASQADWESLLTDKILSVPGNGNGLPITDFVAYNVAATHSNPAAVSARMGLHWVGDLALEADVTVTSPDGKLWLELVEGGRHYRCRIDVASGEAQLSIDGGEQLFDDDAGGENGRQYRTQVCGLRGAGSYRLRFANVDDQLILWVNDAVVEFGASTHFTSPGDLRPRTSPSDPGDLQPLAIGSEGAALEVTDLRVLRDIYYIAVDRSNEKSEYEGALISQEDYPPLNYYEQGRDEERVHRVALATLQNPTVWNVSPIWQARRSVDFPLAADQFFAMGDNSQQSSDARVWSSPDIDWSNGYVERHMLTGKAFVVYWPHGWYDVRIPVPTFPNGVRPVMEPIPLWPDWRRMKRIQ